MDALLSQTLVPDEILIVDNGSTDSTLQRFFPKRVTVIRNATNLGTSGAVSVGLGYAMEHGFDWAWVLDADCAPHPDALEKLVALWRSLPPDVQERTWRLSSLPLEQPPKSVTKPFSLSLIRYKGSAEVKPRHGIVFTDRGYHRVEPDDTAIYYECDATIWSGCFFKLDAVREVGLPPADYVVDWGEYEYGYRGKRCGYRAMMHQRSLLDHNIRGHASFQFKTYRFGFLAFQLIEMPPFRCYYVIRNTLYFWLYEFHARSVLVALPRLLKMILLTLNFVVRPFSRWAELVACLRGFKDGFCKRMEARY